MAKPRLSRGRGKSRPCLLSDRKCKVTWQTVWILMQSTPGSIWRYQMGIWKYSVQFSSVSQSCLFATAWTAACQASLSITSFQSLLRLMSIESVMPSNHLILCRHLLPPSIFPSIRVFSKEKTDFSHQLVKVLEFQLQHQSFQ